ncbi:hypothetical protein [Halobacillus litoralis]|uniref:hypothetical protein n=1 Tax=Halobacillus litoralis TaxID=45668 RepID=UPI001CFE35D7|nr:hypothetical protein [Halobacillus litoralis]
MEKLLVKTAVYTFILSFSVFFVWIDRVKTVKDSSGMYSGVEIPYAQFFFNITHHAIVTTLIILAGVCFVMILRKYKN